MNRRAGADRSNAAGWLWVSPWLIGFALFMLAPLLMSLWYSFTDYPLLERPLWIGLDNYTRMLHDDVFFKALKRTALYGAILIPAATALALVIAALLNSARRGRRLLEFAFFLPSLVPLAASAMIWLWLLNGEHGLINRALALLGIRGPNWLTDRDWVMVAIVIISLWGIGQAIVVFQAALREVPRQLYEAASVDGMGPLRRFRHITVPMVSPVILFNIITLTIGVVQVFAIPFVLTNATPGEDPRAIYFYTMYMYHNAFVYGQMGYASAMAWVQLLLTLALTGLTFFLSRRAVYYRAA